MKLITLFSGIGMQEEGIKNAKIEYDLINYCEYDKSISKCFSLIHEESETKNLGDISSLNMQEYYDKLKRNGDDDIDLIISSFPCQSFSIAGKKMGFQCKKNGNLFDKSFEMISLILPKVVIYENVKNITSKKFNVIEQILVKMNSIGYKCFHQILNSKDYGIPQNRERWFMVCVYLDAPNYKFPNKIKLGKKVEDYLEKPGEKIVRLVDKNMSEYFTDVYKKEYKSTRGLIKVFDGVAEKHFNSGFTTHRIYSVKGVAPTFTTSNDCHFWEIKGKLLPIERWRLMGLDEDKYYILKNAKVSDRLINKICGNGIVVNVFQKIIENLFLHP